MKVMFFRLSIVYVICSFFVLLMFITGRLKLDNPNKNLPNLNNNSIIIALFAWYWPYTLYNLYKSMKYYKED